MPISCPHSRPRQDLCKASIMIVPVCYQTCGLQHKEVEKLQNYNQTHPHYTLNRARTYEMILQQIRYKNVKSSSAVNNLSACLLFACLLNHKQNKNNGNWTATAGLIKGQYIHTIYASEIDIKLHHWTGVVRGESESILVLQLQGQKSMLHGDPKRGPSLTQMPKQQRINWTDVVDWIANKQKPQPSRERAIQVRSSPCIQTPETGSTQPAKLR